MAAGAGAGGAMVAANAQAYQEMQNTAMANSMLSQQHETIMSMINAQQKAVTEATKRSGEALEGTTSTVGSLQGQAYKAG